MANVATTFANIRKGAFKNVRTSLLNVHADIGTRVYGSYPLKNLQAPLIVVENAQIQPGDDTEFLTSQAYRTITVLVNIYAKQAEKLDTYADAVDAQLRSYESTFETYNLILRKDGIVDNGSATFIDANNNRMHVKIISVTFEIDA